MLLARRTPHDREIARLAVPALGALVAEPLYILADTAVVGHLGTAQLGGLAVASSALLSGYAVFVFLAYGTTAAVARLLGAGDVGAAAHEGVQGMWLALAVAALVVPVGYLVAEPVVGALGATAAVTPYALLYLRISLLGVPALLVTLAGTGYLRGLQDTRTPLLVALGTSVGNLVLEVVLIYGLGYAVGASALATVIAQLCGAAVYVVRVARDARGRGARLGPDPRALRRLAVVGGDLFVRTVALRGALLLATATAARMGVVALAAHQVALELWFFLALVLDAVAIAAQAMVGRALGAGQVTLARAVARRMVEIGTTFGVLVALAVVVLRPLLPWIFTSDHRVASVAAFVLWFVAGMQPVNAVVFVLDGVLIGAGDQRFLAVAMVLAAAAFGAAVAAVWGLHLGVGWLWAALTLLMAVRFATLTIRFAGQGWTSPRRA